MFSFFRSNKSSVLMRREKLLVRQLEQLRKDIAEVEKVIQNPDSARSRQRIAERLPAEDEQRDISAAYSYGAPKKDANTEAVPAQRKGLLKRGRPLSADGEKPPAFLASALHADRPLRYERRKQRNQAIIMSVVALLIVLWFVFRRLW